MSGAWITLKLPISTPTSTSILTFEFSLPYVSNFLPTPTYPTRPPIHPTKEEVKVKKNTHILLRVDLTFDSLIFLLIELFVLLI